MFVNRLTVFTALLAASPALYAFDLLDAWQAARQHDPQLAAVEATRQADATLARQGRALRLPTVGLSAGAGTASQEQDTQGARFTMPGMQSDQVDFESRVRNGTATRWGVELRQPLYDREKSASASQLEARARAGAARATADEQGVMLDVAQRYFEVLRLDAALASARAQDEAVAEALGLAQARYDVGDAPVTDLEEARARRDLIAAELLALQQARELAGARLADVTGGLAGRPAAISRDPGPAGLPLAPLAELQARARQHSPLLAAGSAARDAAAEEVGKYRAWASPKLELVARAGEDRLRGSGSAAQYGRQQYAGVELTIPLFTGGWRSARLDEALARREAADAGLRSQALSVDDQVRQAWQGVSVGHARLAALAAARQSVERQLAATRAGIEEGARTTLDLLNAQQARAGIVREQAALRHDTLLDWLRLQAATGDLDPAALARVNALLN